MACHVSVMTRQSRLALSRFTLLLTLGVVFWGADAVSSIVLKELPFSYLIASSQPSDARKVEASRLFQQGSQQYDASQLEAALATWQRALILYREIRDPQGEIDVLISIGNIYYDLGNYPKAIEYQEQSLAIAREIKNRRAEGIALGNLGNAYYLLGDYAKVINYYQQILLLFREIGDRKGEGLTLGNMGFAYIAIGEYSKAIDSLQQSLVIARELKDRRFEGNVLGIIGNAYINTREYQQSVSYLEQSLLIARETQDRQAEGTALGNLGLVYDYLQDYSKAVEYLRQALTITREIKDIQGEGNVLGHLGNSHLFRGEYSKAIQYFQQQLAITRNIKDRRGEGDTLNNLGVALFRSGRLPEAEVSLLAAIRVFESLRLSLQDSQKVSLADTQSQRNPYNTLQRVLIAQNKVESALEISERGRARAFAELLMKKVQESAAGLNQREGLRNQSLSVDPITIQQMKRVAREQDAILVEYSILSEEQLFIWVIKPTGKTVFRQVDLRLLQQEKTSLTNLVAKARCLGVENCEQVIAARGSQSITFNAAQGDRQFSTLPATGFKEESLQRLHKLLIEPIADLLADNSNNSTQDGRSKRIIFIPQGTLFLAPFAAFQDAQGKYLIDHYTISISPSIQVLQLTHQQRQQRSRPGDGKILLVGNPTMPTVLIGPEAPPKQLSALPGAEKEVIAISQFFKVSPFIGNQATKSAILALMPQARIIHLATHGLLDDFGGMGIPGAIALAPNQSKANDGLLTANELLDLKLQAELVVLSACDTGRGKITGDGVIGLSRALITAGVPSVIVSLWAVPDAPTADLMTRFYQNLQQGQNKAQALRQAMLDTKKDFPDPRAWAAFVLIGEAE